MSRLQTFAILSFCVALCSCSSGSGASDESGTDRDYIQTEVVDSVADSGDTTTCLHWHFPQDYTYGEDCWAPPENLCRNGGNLSRSWFCKPDGSACCITASTDCFYCGWIECFSHKTGVDLSDECATLNIPQKYIDCANEKESCLTEVILEMSSGNECLFPFEPADPEYTYCWDDYVE